MLFFSVFIRMFSSFSCSLASCFLLFLLLHCLLQGHYREDVDFREGASGPILRDRGPET